MSVEVIKIKESSTAVSTEKTNIYGKMKRDNLLTLPIDTKKRTKKNRKKVSYSPDLISSPLSTTSTSLPFDSKDKRIKKGTFKTIKRTLSRFLSSNGSSSQRVRIRICSLQSLLKFFIRMAFKKNFIYQLWNVFILVMTVANLVGVTFRSSFAFHTVWMISLDIFVDIVFVLDLIMNIFSNRSYETYKYNHAKNKKSEDESSVSKGKKKQTREVIFQKTHINLYYVFHIHFVFDLFSVVPFYIVGLNQTLWGLYPCFRMNTVAKIVKFNFLFNFIQLLIKMLNASIIKLLYTITLSLVIIHSVGCLWFFMMKMQGDKLGVPFVPGGVDILSMNIVQQYIRSFYLSLITLTGYYNAQPKTNIELVFSLFFSASGLLLYTSIISSIGNIFSEIDIGSTFFQNKMDEINDFFRLRKVSTKLAQRIRDYYHHLWSSRRSLNEETILNDLPIELKIEILLSLNKSLIEKVPFFQERVRGTNKKRVNKQFINQLLLKIKPILAPPKSVIISVGSIGKEMFFIAKGSVEVVVGEEKTVVATLGAGNYFGEIAILLKGTKRTADIRAVEYTDLYMITKEDLIEVLHGFPGQMKIVEKEALKRKKAAVAAKKEQQRIAEEKKQKKIISIMKGESGTSSRRTGRITGKKSGRRHEKRNSVFERGRKSQRMDTIGIPIKNRSRSKSPIFFGRKKNRTDEVIPFDKSNLKDLPKTDLKIKRFRKIKKSLLNSHTVKRVKKLSSVFWGKRKKKIDDLDSLPPSPTSSTSLYNHSSSQQQQKIKRTNSPLIVITPCVPVVKSNDKTEDVSIPIPMPELRILKIEKDVEKEKKATPNIQKMIGNIPARMKTLPKIEFNKREDYNKKNSLIRKNILKSLSPNKQKSQDSLGATVVATNIIQGMFE